MRPKSKLRPAHTVGTFMTLATVAGGLLLTALGSQALAAPQQTLNKPRPTYHRGVASWYYDSGATACGFHAAHGVANRTLRCGTHVRFRYQGHLVTAVVDDRGPYVAGRTWDLGQSTAAALHFSGVAPVWAAVLH